jgi:hypothetical protein
MSEIKNPQEAKNKIIKKGSDGRGVQEGVIGQSQRRHREGTGGQAPGGHQD